MTDKKILLWLGDAPNQRALANKIAAAFPVAAIVIDQKKQVKKPSFFQRLSEALLGRLFFQSIRKAWQQLQSRYNAKYSSWPQVPLIRVESINAEEAYRFSKEVAPDLVVVSGTGLVRKKMLSLTPAVGIVNLHTGLSPYIKGGPNCTNWCIATRQYEMIGNTIMWINEGIDAGNIIASERTDLQGVQSLEEAQWRVMEHAHQLYINAIRYLLNSPPPYSSVPQSSIAAGTLYLTRQWNFSAKRRLIAHLPEFLQYASRWPASEAITVPLK